MDLSLKAKIIFSRKLSNFVTNCPCSVRPVTSLKGCSVDMEQMLL